MLPIYPMNTSVLDKFFTHSGIPFIMLTVRPITKQAFAMALYIKLFISNLLLRRKPLVNAT